MVFERRKLSMENCDCFLCLTQLPQSDVSLSAKDVKLIQNKLFGRRHCVRVLLQKPNETKDMIRESSRIISQAKLAPSMIVGVSAEDKGPQQQKRSTLTATVGPNRR